MQSDDFVGEENVYFGDDQIRRGNLIPIFTQYVTVTEHTHPHPHSL
jgi:hypothetical protein